MTLSSLAIGSLTLTPSFNPDVTEYTATTTNTTNKITATATDNAATITIESDNASIATNGVATWEVGDNVVTVTVSVGEGSTVVENVYTVVVTKS